MKTVHTGDATRRRHDRLVQESVHDPYKETAKPAEPTVCGDCGVIFSEGRWHWSTEPPTDANDALCPACRRIRDRVPAGFLTLSGKFFLKHQDEILNLAENIVDAQQQEHPMKRVMKVEEEDDGVIMTFTDIHLPRTIGTAIEHAYEGDLDIQFGDESGIARAYWSRED